MFSVLIEIFCFEKFKQFKSKNSRFEVSILTYLETEKEKKNIFRQEIGLKMKFNVAKIAAFLTLSLVCLTILIRNSNALPAKRSAAWPANLSDQVNDSEEGKTRTRPEKESF